MNARTCLISFPLLSGALLCALAAMPTEAPHGMAVDGAAVGTSQSVRAGLPGEWNTTPERKAQVEADWSAQDAVRGLGREPVSTREDAAGGCDGVKDGKWGFHTGQDSNPWWQVDLGAAQPLSRVVIYNRCDAADRASHLSVLLSDDGKTWREAYRHDGAVFYGFTDGKPLVAPLEGASARYLRIQLPGVAFLHLDEVEVYGAADPNRNLALGRPADQSSVSEWSRRHAMPGVTPTVPVQEVIARGRRLLASLRTAGVDTQAAGKALEEATREALALPSNASAAARREVTLHARWAVRKLMLANPLLDFDRILFVKRAPGVFSHMSDQNYGWWSRPGGGLYVLEGFKEDRPRVQCLTPGLSNGSCLDPDLSYDGKRILFAWCRYYPQVAGLRDKETKANLPEDSFYHLFEINSDGTDLRQITHGKYDDFDGRYLPNGEIVFLSTRRGQFVQCGQETAMATTRATLPDSYVRCGGDASRPVAVYTLHLMDETRTKLRPLSPFENFEWSPSVAYDGRILYARWDYVDRDNMPYMKLWSTNPDGTNPQIVYGNLTRSPYSVFEARAVPNTRKILFTASAHHSVNGGSLVLLDPSRGLDGPEPLTRLTPEVCFPEIEGWPASYYASPYPLSERTFLTGWSGVGLTSEGGSNPANAVGLYLGDGDGNLELLYRDPAISSMNPFPIRPRARPPVIADSVAWDSPQDEGSVVLLNVYEGLQGVSPGTVKRLRVVGMPAKTQPDMNSPVVGVTGDDPGKFVLGTVPVEPDGSAFFRAPSGVPLFFQALDADGMAVQTMRSLTYLQPHQTMACAGCHEPRNTSPLNVSPLATRRQASRIVLGPEGSWPLRFDQLVQPVLDRLCVSCHGPEAVPVQSTKSRLDLTGAHAYTNLVSYGAPSLRDHVLARYHEGRSRAGAGAARTSALLALLRSGHHGVRLGPDDNMRLVTWMDTYAQRLGAFSADEEESLRRLRTRCAPLLQAP